MSTTLCTFVKRNLERMGEFEVTTANSGPEGLEKARAAAFDLVITDFKMPGMDGGEVLAALRTMKPSMPVVFFSVYHDDQVTISSEMANQADGLISKPIDNDQLYRVIQEALGKQRPAS